MERRNQLALGVFFVLGVAVYMLYSAPERGQRVGERPRPIPRLAKEQIKKVTLTAKGKTVVLERAAAGWRVAAPVQYPADKYASETVERKLEKLEFGDMITERKEKHAAFEVASDKAVRVQVSDGKTTLADFYLGKAESGFTMIRRHGDDKVYQAVGFLRSAFDKELRLWRDRRIISAKRDDVRRVSFATPAGTVTLKRSAAKAPWTLESAPIPLPKLDENAINSALSALQSLSAYDFEDKLGAKDAGLDPPAASVTATLEGDKTARLLIGKKGKETYWVKAASKNQIFTLKHYSLKSLLLRPIDLKDKTILDFDPTALVSLRVERLGGAKPEALLLTPKGDKWASNGKVIAGDKKVVEAVKTLSRLKAHAFATGNAEQVGMASPGWRLTLTLKGTPKATYLLRVGSKEEEGSRAVQLNDGSDLFLLRKHVLERVLLDPTKFQ